MLFVGTHVLNNDQDYVYETYSDVITIMQSCITVTTPIFNIRMRTGISLENVGVTPYDYYYLDGDGFVTVMDGNAHHDTHTIYDEGAYEGASTKIPAAVWLDGNGLRIDDVNDIKRISHAPIWCSNYGEMYVYYDEDTGEPEKKDYFMSIRKCGEDKQALAVYDITLISTSADYELFYAGPVLLPLITSEREED